MFGGYKWVLATIMFFGIVVPFTLLPFRKIRTSPWPMLLVGLSVNVAMYTERVSVVIPPAARDWLTWGDYTPTWQDLSVSAGAIGLFGFLYTLLTKFIPMVSLWEHKEGEMTEGEEIVGATYVSVVVREEAIS
jgi:molybdopterin-containing oxidoreductase family membrane subunit